MSSAGDPRRLVARSRAVLVRGSRSVGAQNPQNSIPWWSTRLEEEADAAAASIRGRRLGRGPTTRAFEAEFAARHGVAHAVATTSGTTALFLAYWALGLGPGDEVLVPDGTFVATANAAAARGLKVRPVDLHPESYTFDAD